MSVSARLLLIAALAGSAVCAGAFAAQANQRLATDEQPSLVEHRRSTTSACSAPVGVGANPTNAPTTLLTLTVTG